MSTWTAQFLLDMIEGRFDPQILEYLLTKKIDVRWAVYQTSVGFVAWKYSSGHSPHHCIHKGPLFEKPTNLTYSACTHRSVTGVKNYASSSGDDEVTRWETWFKEPLNEGSTTEPWNGVLRHTLRNSECKYEPGSVEPYALNSVSVQIPEYTFQSSHLRSQVSNQGKVPDKSLADWDVRTAGDKNRPVNVHRSASYFIRLYSSCAKLTVVIWPV